MDPLVTIKNLIALACSSHSEEEARSSALAACKAISRHGVVLGLPGEQPETSAAPAPPQPKPRAAREDPLAGTPFSRRGYEPTPKPSCEPTKSKGRTKRASPFSARTNHPSEGGPVRMASRYEAWCKGCGAQVKANETIWWKKGVGVTCEVCGPKPLVGSQP